MGFSDVPTRHGANKWSLHSRVLVLGVGNYASTLLKEQATRLIALQVLDLKQQIFNLKSEEVRWQHIHAENAE